MTNWGDVNEKAGPNEANMGGPHEFRRQGWRWWNCRHCYLPRDIHPVRDWSIARPLRDHSRPHARKVVRR